MKGSVALGLVCLACAGCTSLSTSTDRITADRTQATTGVPYSLPMLQYEVTVTRSLTQCFEPGADGKPTATPHVIFSAKVEAVPKNVPGETYLMDYRALAGYTKITSLAIENYESGTLHSINASAEDRSGQIIEGAVKTAVSIAMMAGGIPPVAAAGDVPLTAVPMMLVCAPGTQQLLDAVADRTADLRTANTTLEGLTERINLLTEQARLNTISEAGKLELTGPGGLIEQQRAAARVVATAQTRLSRAQDAVTSTTRLRWPRTLNTSAQDVPLEGDELGRLARLVTRASLVAGENATENECGTDQDAASVVAQCVGSKLEVGLALESLSPAGGVTVATAEQGVVDPAGTTPARGIFIRPPVRGRLIACQLGRESVCTDQSRRVLLRTDDAVVPQFGQLRFLPFRNEMFQNNALSVSLRADGSVEKLEYRETSSRGERLATTASGVAGQLQGLAQAIRANDQTQETAAAAAVVAERNEALAALQSEVQRRTVEAQLALLNQPPQTSQLATVQAETAQVNARVALLQALLAERTATNALANSD